MTVIACKDGVIAADTSSWQGDILTGRASKLFRLKDGSVYGACGWKPIILKAVAWLDAGAPPNEKPEAPPDKNDVGGLVLRPDGSIWSIHEKFEFWPLDASFAVAGSHHEFLMGAMLAGASAKEAVALAIHYCQYAGGEVEVMCVARKCL